MHPWHGILNIPEDCSGSFEVFHHVCPPDTRFEQVTYNQLMLGTLPAEEPITFEQETKWHILRDGGGVWMTDYPLCQYSTDWALKPILSGTVLVGGLGLGYAATILANRPGIERIIVVEKEANVNELIVPHLTRTNVPFEFIEDDLFSFLDHREYMLDINWAFYDIWRAEEGDAFFTCIDPLIRSTRRYLKQENIICWNEAVFRRQMQIALQIKFQRVMAVLYGDVLRAEEGENSGLTLEALCTKKGDIYHDWAVPFFKKVNDGSINRVNVVDESLTYSSWYGRRDNPWWA